MAQTELMEARMILKTGEGGFTLIELILVFAIITTLIGITIPSFQGTVAKERLKSSAGDLASTIDYAHWLSVLKGHRHRLICDLDKGSYRITKEKHPRESPGRFYKIQSHECREKYLPKGIHFESISTESSSFSNGLVSIDFSPDGTCNGHIIRIASNLGESLGIQTFSNTSSVMIKKPAI